MYSMLCVVPEEFPCTILSPFCDELIITLALGHWSAICKYETINFLTLFNSI